MASIRCCKFPASIGIKAGLNLSIRIKQGRHPHPSFEEEEEKEEDEEDDSHVLKDIPCEEEEEEEEEEEVEEEEEEEVEEEEDEKHIAASHKLHASPICFRIAARVFIGLSV